MFIIQIGAQDGFVDTHRKIDEVYLGITKYNWHGVLLEPNPRHFAELQKTYKKYKDKVELLELAVANHTGHTIFYDCPEPGASSLFEDVLKKNNYHNGKALDYKSIIVKCITINELLEKYGIPNYLIIDAEGYDGEIIENIDLNKFLIQKIRFEFSHISDEQLGRVCLRLLKFGYTLQHDKADIIANKNNI